MKRKITHYQRHHKNEHTNQQEYQHQQRSQRHGNNKDNHLQKINKDIKQNGTTRKAMTMATKNHQSELQPDLFLGLMLSNLQITSKRRRKYKMYKCRSVSKISAHFCFITTLCVNVMMRRDVLS